MMTSSLSAMSANLFKIPIPQPDFVSNDWDGDGIINSIDNDDDNDNELDVNDSTPFGGRPKSSVSLDCLESSIDNGWANRIDNRQVTRGVFAHRYFLNNVAIFDDTISPFEERYSHSDGFVYFQGGLVENHAERWYLCREPS